MTTTIPHAPKLSQDTQSNSGRHIVESIQLPSKCVTTPSGVSLRVSSAPHRNGNPEHKFYEVWLTWEGGTLRSSTAIHCEATRRAVVQLLETLTGVNYYDLLNDTLNKYDWHVA